MPKERTGNRALVVVGYIRVSTEEQAESGSSLGVQRRKITEYASVYGLPLSEVIEDGGQSAKDMNRPGVQRILQMIQKRDVSTIIVHKLDRLTRSVRDLGTILDLCEKKGIALMSVEEKLDTSCAAGRMVLNIMATVSQWEREVIGERTATVLRAKRENRQKFNSTAPYGFRFDGPAMIEEPTEQAVVNSVRQLCGEGKGYREVGRELARQGFKTRSGSSTWNAQTVKNILKNCKGTSEALQMRGELAA